MTNPIHKYACTTVQELDGVKRMVDDLADAGTFAFDFETRSEDFDRYPEGALRKMTMEADLCSFATADQRAWVVPLGMVTMQNAPTQEFFSTVKPLMEDTGILKLAWNFSYDAAVFANYDVWVACYEDVMIKAHTLDENAGAGLKTRCADGGMELTPYDFKTYWKMRHAYRKRDLDKKGEQKVRDADLHPLEMRYVEYSAEDSIATIVLNPIYDLELAKYPKLKELYHRLLNPAVRTVFNMERRGVPIDRVYFNVIGTTCKADADVAEAQVYRAAQQHFNIGSTKDLGRVLYQELGLPVFKTTGKGANSTDADSLQKLAQAGYKIAEDILRFRHLGKLFNTYLDPDAGLAKHVYDWGSIHASFNLTGTSTGRLSSSSPNMQQCPRSSDKTYFIRKGFVPHQGYRLVGGDFSQVELRMMAHFSGDATMCAEYRKDEALWKALNNRASKEDIKALSKVKSDIHQKTADSCKCKRNPTAKCVSPETLLQKANGSLVSIGNIGEFGPVDSFHNLGVDICNEASTVTALQTFNGGRKMLYRVLTRRGGVICTKEHKLALEDGRVVKVRNLKKGDVVKEAKVLPLPKKGKMPKVSFRPMSACPVVDMQTTYELAYVAGLFSGDGIKCTDHSIGICHGAVEKTDQLGTSYAVWQQIIVDACSKAGLDTTTKQKSVYLGSRASMRLFIALGLLDSEDGHRSLSIPDWVLTDQTSAKHFFAGLFDTDGTVAPTGQASFTTKDFLLATRAATALRALGAEVYIEPCWNKTYEKWYYRTHISVRHCADILSLMRHPGKVARLKPSSQCMAGRPQKPNAVTLIQEDGVGQCCDLFVDSEDHLYSANGLVTHNSINFGLLYGMMSKRLAGVLTAVNFVNCLESGIPFDHLTDVVPVELAQEFYDLFFNTYPGIKTYQEYIGDKAKRQGYIETRWGRRRRLPDVYSGDRWLVMGAQRQAVNVSIQGHVGEMVLLAMCKMENVIPNPDGEALKKLGFRMFLQVHDEVLGECPDDDSTVEDVKYHLTRIAQNPGPCTDAYPYASYRTPIIFEAQSGVNWDQVH